MDGNIATSTRMEDESDCRLLSLPASVLGGMQQPAIRDAVMYFDPEIVVIPGHRNVGGYVAACEAATTIPVVHPQLGRAGESVRHFQCVEGHSTQTVSELESVTAMEGMTDEGTIDIIAVQNGAVLADVATDLYDGHRRTDERAATYIVVPALTVEWETTTLSAHLPYADEIATIVSSLPERVVVLAGRQPVTYRHEWSLPRDGRDVNVSVVGLGAQSRGDLPIALLRCTENGSSVAECVPADRFGLRALSGVGASTARRLHQLGCHTRSEVVDLGVDDLSKVSGIGRKTAERIHAHAEVIASGNPLVYSNKTVVKTRDGRPPLCLDIETDGLSPTIIWQFGVYDPAEDNYQSFVEKRTPNEPSDVLGAFVEWMLANHSDRTVLTWNGDGFDYLHINRFLRRYYPHYVDEWNEIWTYDLYKWTVRDGNALLPGRTNKLSHVARTLGYQGYKTGLSGARTAAIYQEFMRRPDDPDAVPDWERHEAYCEDDCKALWYVFDAIERAERRDMTDYGAGGAVGQQAGLTDFKK